MCYGYSSIRVVMILWVNNKYTQHSGLKVEFLNFLTDKAAELLKRHGTDCPGLIDAEWISLWLYTTHMSISASFHRSHWGDPVDYCKWKILSTHMICAIYKLHYIQYRQSPHCTSINRVCYNLEKNPCNECLKLYPKELSHGVGSVCTLFSFFRA